MAEVLTPDSPRWAAFTDALNEALYISETQWRCDGDAGQAKHPDIVHRYAKQIMTTMGDIDIPSSLAFFKTHGGHCDCEILFNVDK